MKKVLLAFVMLMAVGAGCTPFAKFGGDKQVEGDWYLAFDLPGGWVMTEPYREPNVEVVVPVQQVDRAMPEIFLQSTPKAIVSNGAQPGEAVPADTYVTSDYQEIRVTRLDPRRVVPSEAEDLGNGFSKVSATEYYLETDGANYKFDVRMSDSEGNLDQVERIIRSAEEVTVLDVQATKVE